MRKRGNSVALGALLVAGIGYVAGVMTAPKSGRETRKDIQRAALKAKSEAEHKLKDLHSELTQLIDESLKKGKNLKQTAKNELVDALSTAQVTKEKARELLSALHEGEADDKDLQKAIKEVKASIDHIKKYLKK